MNNDISKNIEFLQASLSKPIVLIGPPCAGKTTVGRDLARKLNILFKDADDRIVENEGMSIEDIFAQRQELGFREAEVKAIKGLVAEGFFILSTGGGAFTQPKLQEILNAEGLTVFLKASAETINERYQFDVANDAPVRPRLVENTEQAILDKIDERYPEYSKAHITIDTDKISVEEACEAIIKGLYKHLKPA